MLILSYYHIVIVGFCYVWSRNQKQTGIRQNRKCLFKAKVRSQVIRICKGTESQGRIVIVSRSI